MPPSSNVFVVVSRIRVDRTTYGVDRPRPSRPCATASLTYSTLLVRVGADLSTDPHRIDCGRDWPRTAALGASARR
jgi:hypothetical protein